ncbi:hypothetical protein HHK36_026005 [Tetracentron sinense]|uniref:glycerol kinase n=1 Tax=Tetracentron sinense TaxID=13715 RepID=A0A835D649_TETSI|nr:hypothetical protein HHK36_026005 [Tetracentron sinense]
MRFLSKNEVFIGSIVQGTTSTRFIIYDRSARAVGSHQVEFTQFYPEAGWVEHNPMEILESVKVCIAKALDKATADGHNVDKGLKVIGLTNQRETTLVWSKSIGFPLYDAIVWMDARTSSICRKLEKELSISTYFSALKLFWLLENVEAVKEAVKTGDALFGTIDTWLIWNLTGGYDGEDLKQNKVKDVLDSMHKDAGEKGKVKDEKGEFLLRVGGGATINNLLMQIQADLLGSSVVRPTDIETTAPGAAYAAGLAVGVRTEKEENYDSTTLLTRTYNLL